MKVVIPKDDLVKSISHVQHIISSKPTIPILANILLEASEDQLILYATDLSVSMRCSVSAKIIEPGSLAIPARKFFQLVRELSVAQIKISVENNTVIIQAGDSVFRIHGMDKTEFPSLPDLKTSSQISFLSTQLKTLLQKSVFSAAKEESRYILNGVKMEIQNQIATFVGTDGKRLAKTSSSIEIDPSFLGSYILPLKAVDEMIRILDSEDASVIMNVMHDKISLESSNITLYAKLLSGQYPDVEKVIPEKDSSPIHLHREELMMLLRQISLFTSDTTSSVRFSFDQGALHLSAISRDIGEGNVSMPIDFSKTPFEVAFNPYYFLDILRHCKDETVEFSIQDAYNPGLITDSSSAIFVIMPMRLSDAPKVEDATEKAVLT